jgi:hypothetical protein
MPEQQKIHIGIGKPLRPACGVGIGQRRIPNALIAQSPDQVTCKVCPKSFRLKTK